MWLFILFDTEVLILINIAVCDDNDNMILCPSVVPESDFKV